MIRWEIEILKEYHHKNLVSFTPYYENDNILWIIKEYKDAGRRLPIYLKNTYVREN